MPEARVRAATIHPMLYSFESQRVEKPAACALSDLTDEELMIRITLQDNAALEALYLRHRPLLRTIIGRTLNNDTDTEDVLQEVFVEVWNLATHYSEQKGKPLGWLVTMARRRAIDRLRKKTAYARAQDRFHHEVENQPEPALQYPADREVVAADTADFFRNVIGGLPVAQQEVLHCAYYLGMSQRQIAAHTGVALGTVKTRLDLALRKVRAGLLAKGGSEEWIVSRGYGLGSLVGKYARPCGPARTTATH
jgi:RNA polymerase sigma-70 factor (ECF subfamily)